MLKDIEPFDKLVDNAANLIYKTLEDVEHDRATKAGLVAALNKLDALMFLISRTPEEMKVVNAARKEANSGLH
jgi:hypothetical protein